MRLIVKRSVIVIYICTTIKAVSFLRKRKRFAVCEEQNKAVCGIVDPLIKDPLKESIVMLCYESGDHGQSVIGYFMSTLARPDNITFRANEKLFGTV